MMSNNIRAAHMARAGAFTAPNHPATAKSVPRTMPMFPQVNLPINGGQYAGNHHLAMPSHFVQPAILPGMIQWQQNHGLPGPTMSYMAPPNPLQMPNFRGLPAQDGKKPAKKLAANASRSSFSPKTPPTPTPIGRKARQAIPGNLARVNKVERYDNRKLANCKNVPTTSKAADGSPPETPKRPDVRKRSIKGPKTPAAAMLLSVAGCEDWQLNMARNLGLQDIAGPFEIGDAIYVIISKSREATRLANRRVDRRGRLAWLRHSDNVRLDEKPQQQTGEPVANADGSFRGFKATENTLVTPRA
ncbi:unnamed protein product [Clonostachys rosea]|uniref:Uncharacterized protein n=1 Tax=Bionectria ochroleuca TaxID=29856 RepID=A0ABY6UHD4_BIOOC|nr:unnamed protein product [Clonostachys rosea]